MARGLALNGLESLPEVGNDVLSSFDADGEADEVRLDASFNQLFIRKLAVSVAGGVQHTGAGICNVGYNGGELEAVHELDSALTATLDADARTCVLHPASHTHRQLTDEQLIEAGVKPDLIRYSVGIEAAEDIIADLKQAFAAIQG